MNQLEMQAYRLVKRRFKLNRQKDLIKVHSSSSRSVELSFSSSDTLRGTAPAGPTYTAWACMSEKVLSERAG